MRCDPNNFERLVTVGVRHIKFWSIVGGGLTSKRGTYGDVGKAETQLCVTYPKEAGMLVTGAANGKLYIWKNEVWFSLFDGELLSQLSLTTALSFILVEIVGIAYDMLLLVRFALRDRNYRNLHN